jgi:type I restriction enzyme S subunit
MIGLRPNKKVVDPPFLALALSSKPTQEFLNQRTTGMAESQVNFENVALLEAPLYLPPLKEQEAIAETLSDADAAIRYLDALIAKKRDVKQATMQQLLTGRTRLPGFTSDWKVAPLGKHAYMLKGSGLSRSKLSNSGKYSALLYGELFTVYGRIIQTARSRTSWDEGISSISGDVLMPGSTTTTGEDLATASALLQNDVRIGGDVNMIRPNLNEVDPVGLPTELQIVIEK